MFFEVKYRHISLWINSILTYGMIPFYPIYYYDIIYLFKTHLFNVIHIIGVESDPEIYVFARAKMKTRDIEA